MIDISKNVESIDLKIKFSKEIGGKRMIHYTSIRKDLFPELFENIINSVNKDMNKNITACLPSSVAMDLIKMELDKILKNKNASKNLKPKKSLNPLKIEFERANFKHR